MLGLPMKTLGVCCKSTLNTLPHIFSWEREEIRANESQHSQATQAWAFKQMSAHKDIVTFMKENWHEVSAASLYLAVNKKNLPLKLLSSVSVKVGNKKKAKINRHA